MKLLDRFARKHFNKWDGILTFYTVYNPNKEGTEIAKEVYKSSKKVVVI